MTPHSIGSATISFGLVSIPVKLYTAASSAGVSHEPCGSAHPERIEPRDGLGAYQFASQGIRSSQPSGKGARRGPDRATQRLRPSGARSVPALRRP
jgi:hypothetical protein